MAGGREEVGQHVESRTRQLRLYRGVAGSGHSKFGQGRVAGQLSVTFPLSGALRPLSHEVALSSHGLSDRLLGFGTAGIRGGALELEAAMEDRGICAMRSDVKWVHAGG